MIINHSPEAFKLLMRGAQALSRVEANGMRIDTDYLDRMLVKTADRISQWESDIKQDEVYHIWRKTYGEKTDLGSTKQLGHIIFNVMGVECTSRTKTGLPTTSAEVLEAVDYPFLNKLINIEKLKKTRNTFLSGIKKETVNEILHPFFNLHTVVSYRSSSDSPNLQNQPKRDKRMRDLVRKAIIPRSDEYAIIEFDGSGMEVRGAACYHQDPTMIQYILDDYDLHKDMAAECYLLDLDQVSKPTRQEAKGKFVFSSFYGDWYKSICANLWNTVDKEKLTLVDGTSLRDHLTSKGITKLGDVADFEAKPVPGTYEHHIKGVADKFWNERFSVYTQWKKDWWEAYLRDGWFQMKTGFVCQGIFKKNEVINYGIQGSSFHIILWALIEMNDWLVKNKMKSMIIGTIHDSVVLDVYKKEYADVMHMMKHLMTVAVRKAWDWIIVPLEVEAEGSSTNWAEMSDINLKGF